jgi:LacI family transcriptional regulator
VIGHGPAEEIRRVRLERARELLTASDLSIEQIAQAVGFLTATRLGVAFRKQFGMTPRDWRANQGR